ncbi:hypothetical protein ACRRTK_021072 [Alexandromys fortis]
MLFSSSESVNQNASVNLPQQPFDCSPIPQLETRENQNTGYENEIITPEESPPISSKDQLQEAAMSSKKKQRRHWKGVKRQIHHQCYCLFFFFLTPKERDPTPIWSRVIDKLQIEGECLRKQGSHGHRTLIGGNKTYFLGRANKKETLRDVKLPTTEKNNKNKRGLRRCFSSDIPASAVRPSAKTCLGKFSDTKRHQSN